MALPVRSPTMANLKSFFGSAPMRAAGRNRIERAAVDRRTRPLSQMRVFSNPDTNYLKMLELFAVWVLLSGLDDLILDIASLYRWFGGAFLGRPTPQAPTEAELDETPPSRIAIFVPLWREHGVIRSMIEHNVVALRYDRCDFFIGVYPNDPQTLQVVRELDARFPNVHVSVCPHDGPTSKADNLNWIFQGDAAIRIRAARALRNSGDARRRGPDPSRRAALDQLLHRALRHGADSRAAVSDAGGRAGSRRLLRRVRRVPEQRPAGAPVSGRLSAFLRSGRGLIRGRLWSAWRWLTRSACSSRAVSPKTTRTDFGCTGSDARSCLCPSPDGMARWWPRVDISQPVSGPRSDRRRAG